METEKKVICKVCGKTKLEEDCFHYNPNTDNEFHKCKECYKKDICSCLFCNKHFKRKEGISITLEYGFGAYLCKEDCLGNPNKRFNSYQKHLNKKLHKLSLTKQACPTCGKTSFILIHNEERTLTKFLCLSCGFSISRKRLKLMINPSKRVNGKNNGERT